MAVSRCAIVYDAGTGTEVPTWWPSKQAVHPGGTAVHDIRSLPGWRFIDARARADAIPC
jgi:hypothetical protein